MEFNLYSQAFGSFYCSSSKTPIAHLRVLGTWFLKQQDCFQLLAKHGGVCTVANPCCIYIKTSSEVKTHLIRLDRKPPSSNKSLTPRLSFSPMIITMIIMFQVLRDIITKVTLQSLSHTKIQVSSLAAIYTVAMVPDYKLNMQNAPLSLRDHKGRGGCMRL